MCRGGMTEKMELIDDETELKASVGAIFNRCRLMVSSLVTRGDEVTQRLIQLHGQGRGR